VHHRVAHVQLGQVFDQRFHIADLLLLFAAARGGAGGKQLGLGDQVNACFQPTEALASDAEVAMPMGSLLS